MDSKTRKVLNHFRKTDPILYSIARKIEIEPVKPRKPSEFYSSLCREIIGQQLNGKVARVIFNRYLDLFPKRKATPEKTLKISADSLRNVGMAWSKVEAIKDLARKTSSGELNFEKMRELNDEEVSENLIQVKGIGPWTAQMFLMFTLGREDVFSHGDLGLRKAIVKHYGLKKEPTEEKLERITKKWSPYRTYACRALWKSIETRAVINSQ